MAPGGPGGEGAEGARLALLRGNEMLPTPSCSVLPRLQQDPGLSPTPAVLSQALSPAGRRRSSAGMWQERRLAWSKEVSLQSQTTPHEGFAWTPNGFANLGQRKAACLEEGNQQPQAALNLGR